MYLFIYYIINFLKLEVKYDKIKVKEREKREKMKNKDIIFFDLDGTITDSKSGIFHSIRYALQFFGMKEQDDEKLSLFLGPPLIDSFIKYYDMDEARAATALLKYREYYSEKGVYDLTMYEGMDALLKKLKEYGFIVCLATAKPLFYAKGIIERIDLLPYFDFLGGATMDESMNSKFAVIKHVIEQNGFEKNRILMVGDRADDIFGAFKNGIEALGVLYGYGSREELKNAGCKYFAENVKDVEKIILEQ